MSEESDLCATFDNVANIKDERGCDELLDHMCEICEVIDESRQVFGYCNQCQQYLCHRCTRQHAKVKATHRHKIIGTEDLKDTRVAKSLYEGKLIPLSYYEIPKLNIEYFGIVSPTYIEVSSLKIDGNTVNAILFKYDLCLGRVHLHAYNGNGTLILSTNINSRVSSMMQSSDDETMIFFCEPENKLISKYHLKADSDRLSLEKAESIKYSGKCFGMTNFNNGLAVLMNIPSRALKVPDWQLQYLDYDGNIKQRICYTSDGTALFEHPVHIASNNEQTILFVLENTPVDSHILALDIHGEILYKIENDEQNNISLPISRHLSVDEENNIYVACEKTRVVQVHNATNKTRELFNSSSTETNCLFGFNKATRTLVVAEDKNPEVLYYSLC